MAGLAFPIRVAARYAAVGVTPFLTGPRDKLSYYEKQMAASPTEPLGEFLSTALRAGGLEGRGPDVAQFLERAIPAASRLYLGRPWVQLSATSEVHSLGMAVFNDASTVSAAFHEYGRELGLDPGALEIARMFAAAMPRSAYGQLRAEVRSGEPTRASVYFGWLLNPLRGHGGFDRLLSNLPPAFRSSSVADNAARLAERCRPDLYPYGVGLSFVPGQVEPEVKLYVTRYDERRSPLRGSGSLHALLATLELPAQELARVHDLHDRLWESAATKAIQVAISVSPQRRPADRISLIYCGARIDEAQKALTGDGITDTTPLNVLHTSFGSERAMYLGINVGPRGLSRRMKVYEAGFFRNTDLAALRRGRATGEQATSGVPPAPRPSRGQAPGPRKRQTPGVLARLVRSPFDEMQSLRERYGDVVALPDLGSAKTCFVFGPDGVERMFRDNSKNYVRGANFRGVSKVVGNGIVASEGEFWRRQRKQVQPALSKGVVATQVESMVAIIAATLDAWEERADSGDWVDIAHQMRLVTRKITLKVMLGIDEENEANDISRSWEEVYDALTYFTTRPWQLPTRVPTPRNRAFKTAMAALDQRIYEKIAEHQRDPEAAGDLVRALLAARDPISGRPMTQRQLRDELVTVSSAGFDTAAVTLAWTAYLLSQHPWAAHRVAAEADEVFGDRLPTVEDLP